MAKITYTFAQQQAYFTPLVFADPNAVIHNGTPVGDELGEFAEHKGWVNSAGNVDIKYMADMKRSEPWTLAMQRQKYGGRNWMMSPFLFGFDF